MNRRSQQSAGFSQGTPQWNMKQHMRRLNKMHKVHHLLLSCLNHSQWTLRRIQVSVYIYTYKYLLLIYLYYNLVYHSLWSLCQETNCFIAVLKLGRPLATSSIHDLKANRQRRIVPLRSTRSLLSSPHDAKLARKAYLKNSNDLTTLEAWIKVLGLSSLASYAHTAASFWVVKNFTVSRHHTCKKIKHTSYIIYIAFSRFFQA